MAGGVGGECAVGGVGCTAGELNVLVHTGKHMLAFFVE